MHAGKFDGELVTLPDKMANYFHITRHEYQKRGLDVKISWLISWKKTAQTLPNVKGNETNGLNICSHSSSIDISYMNG